jgi:Flp pilus assembly protein TadB
MQEELAAIKSDAEMDVRSVLESMWENAPDEEKQEYIDEFECLSDKYIAPMEGLRVRYRCGHICVCVCVCVCVFVLVFVFVLVLVCVFALQLLAWAGVMSV